MNEDEIEDVDAPLETGVVGGHTPVLVSAVSRLLAPQPGETVLDGTVGLGGHALILGRAVGPGGRVIGLDVDAANLEAAAKNLSSINVVLRRENYRFFDEVLGERGVTEVDIMLLDLGVSSTQLETSSRGFSFRSDGPLDMRMDDRLTTTAADLVNRLSETELADLIFNYGQETQSRRIARRICQLRRDGRITTTSALVAAIADALHVDPESRRSKIHPATQTFQALRMAVNDELGALEEFLEKAPKRLKSGGRLGVISFHSGEDRIVKSDFARRRESGVYKVLTKKPVVADEDERRSNPRSRSAKLRVAVRSDLPC